MSRALLLLCLSAPLWGQKSTLDEVRLAQDYTRGVPSQKTGIHQSSLHPETRVQIEGRCAKGCTANRKPNTGLPMPVLPTVARGSSAAFRISQGIALAGAVADVRSSYGLVETNPLLGSGNFGHRQAALSLGITAGLVLIEGPLVRKYPAMKKPLTWANWIIGGVRFGAAVHNSRLK